MNHRIEIKADELSEAELAKDEEQGYHQERSDKDEAFRHEPYSKKGGRVVHRTVMRSKRNY